MKPAMKAVAFTRFTTLRALLTAGQRAFAKVAYDGLEPADLTGAERERAREIWGDVETIPAEARRVVVQVKGRDVGGSRLGAERCLHLGYTLPLDRIGYDELAYVVFGGPKIRHARVGLRHALNAARKNGLKVDGQTRDGFTLVRHDGRRVRFECFAASRGGDNMRGVPIIAALLDEAAFFVDESSGAFNGENIFGAIVPRLLPGGQILIVSSPWAESGLLHSEFVRNHGHPVTAIAAFCPTTTMRDDAETLGMVERERIRDPENARRELDAEFLPTGAGYYFDRFALDACPLESMPLTLPSAEQGWKYFGGYDPAYVSDAAEGVIVRSKGLLFEVADVFIRVPAKGKPLVPSVVDREFAELVKRHGGKQISSDIHYEQSVREHVRGLGLSFHAGPGGNSGKAEVYGCARELVSGGRVKWSAGHLRLTRQMREVVSKPLSGGLIAISSPRHRGNHGDGASALCLALWLAHQASKSANRYFGIASVGSDWSARQGARVTGSSVHAGLDYSLPPDERWKKFFNQG